jgi:hypothetical protein
MHLISDFSLWFLIPIGLFSVILTFYFYKKDGWFGDLKPFQQTLLRILRFSSLFLIGILLLGLILQTINYRDEKPVFINLIDNSNSMMNHKDSNLVKNQIASYREKLKEKYGERFELIDLYVGSNVSNQKLDFSEKTSNLEAGFEKINFDYYNRNIGGITFISDGNYNVGTNPAYAAEKISITPIFSLAVGDTTPRKDQLIKNVSVNDIAFLKNEFPVEVDVESIKLGGKSVSVSIFENGKQIASQSITYSNSKRDFKQVNFTLKANKIGFQTYVVKLKSLDGESTLKNNQRTFYVEVIDSRNKVLLLAGAPHPDISALKEVLDQNENIESESVLIKDWNKNLEKTDLVVWHEPGANFDASILQLLQEKRIPILYILGPNTEAAVATKLNLGISGMKGNKTDDIQPTLASGFNDFELSEKVAEALDFYPPLKSKFGTLKVEGNPLILLNQRVGPVKKSDPLLFFVNRNNLKTGVLYGEGIWRWKLNDFIRSGNHEAFSELFSKTMNFLMVKQQEAGLRIEFPKRFSIEEDVMVNASFYNSALEPITKPKIELKLTDSEGKVFRSQFGANGNGYKLSLGKLKAGKYKWYAETKFNGKSYKKSGVFIVEDIELEKIETAANHGVLKQVAKQSNGKFYFLKDNQKLINDIEKRGDITTISFEETAFNKLIDYLVVILLLIALLASEWFIRRFLGSY